MMMIVFIFGSTMVTKRCHGIGAEQGRRLDLILRHADQAGEQDQEHQRRPLPDVGDHDRDQRQRRVGQPGDRDGVARQSATGCR